MYVYCIQLPDHLKIGRWSGGISALYSRYGNSHPTFDVTCFQTEDSKSFEKTVHTELRDFHLIREMFRLEAYPVFMDFCNRHALPSCQSTDLEAKCTLILRRKYKMLERANDSLAKRIAYLEQKLEEKKDQSRQKVERNFCDPVPGFLSAPACDLRKITKGTPQIPLEWIQYSIEIKKSEGRKPYGTAWALVQEAFEVYRKAKNFSAPLRVDDPAWDMHQLRAIEKGHFYDYRDGVRKNTRHIVGLVVRKAIHST